MLSIDLLPVSSVGRHLESGVDPGNEVVMITNIRYLQLKYPAFSENLHYGGRRWSGRN